MAIVVSSSLVAHRGEETSSVLDSYCCSYIFCYFFIKLHVRNHLIWYFTDTLHLHFNIKLVLMDELAASR